MRKTFALLLAAALCASCQTTPKDIPVWDFSKDGSADPSESPYHSDDPSSTDPSKDDDGTRKEIPAYTDMVLVYGYSPHRSPYNWTEEYMRDYVSWTDPATGKSHWLFDAFLCLEFMDCGGHNGNKTFITGYKYNGNYLESANKSDWESLADYYFQDYVNVGAIDRAVGDAAKTLGQPSHKRQIVVGIPEPIEYRYNNYGQNQSGGTTYWGEIDGKTMDFSKSKDRLTAVKWYIDTVIKLFNARNYQNVELGGFYLTAERSDFVDDILIDISRYLQPMKYSFNWIPYFHAYGYTNWKQYGFTYAFMQPNYFFSEEITYDRLTTACQDVLENGMGMEIEFDGKVLDTSEYKWGYRLRDYMKAARDYEVWDNCKLVYYQGSWAVRWLKYSTSEIDRELFNDFCKFVVERPLRDDN